MMDGGSILRAKTGVTAVVAAALLLLAACLGGCSMRNKEVTERDIEVARQMDAPGDVVESLGRGVWPSDIAREKVRNAEACIDYLAGRYGLEFSAVSATGGSTWMTGSHDVVLRIESGDHAGEEVHLKYAGDPDDPEQKGAYFKEDCYWIVNHGEWERIASEAVLPLCAGIPDGSYVLHVGMNRKSYSFNQIDRPIIEGGGTGEVRLFVDATELSEEDIDGLLSDIRLAMDATGLRGTVCIYGYESEDAVELISAGEAPSLSGHSQYESLPFGV